MASRPYTLAVRSLRRERLRAGRLADTLGFLRAEAVIARTDEERRVISAAADAMDRVVEGAYTRVAIAEDEVGALIEERES